MPFIGSPDNAVEIDAVSKSYAPQRGEEPKLALENMTLNIPQGSVFGLLGPNGAGKSTLINILAGTVMKTSGSAKIWGVDIDENPKQARASIGIVPQELNIDAFFTPRETLEFSAGMYAVPKSERRTDAILEEIGLTHKANAYSRTLSGGMKRRLLIGKAMVHQPPVLVLDEPTAGVDVSLRRNLWELIRNLNAMGVTIILTTHYLEEAEALCDRIAIIHEGRLLREATTKDLLAGAGSKSIALHVQPSLEAVPSSLSDLNAQVQDGVLQIYYDPHEVNAGVLLKRVSEAGLTITDVTTEEPDLEDVFLELTDSGD